jgi:RNA polymerase sigma factor (sigma-70 family)
MAATLTVERTREGRPDTDLVAAARAGDDRAFETLYERYHPAIVRYAHGMVRDWARAEDVTQDVFISALRRMRETERPIAFKPWIYEIARNACIDQFRRTRRAEELPFDSDGLRPRERAELADRRTAPERAIELGEQIDHLRGAFGGLSESHHRILVLRELEGLSYHEIGQRMGMTRPSVESTLFRARRRLGEEWDEVRTGRRCADVRAALAPVCSGLAGARERRRVQRHLAWCAGCRRHAHSSGLPLGTLVPQGAAGRAAAVLPLPFVSGAVFDSNAGWFKAVAAALGLAAASTGASLAVYAVPDAPLHPRRPAPPVSAGTKASLGHAQRATATHSTAASIARTRAARARAAAAAREAPRAAIAPRAVARRPAAASPAPPRAGAAAPPSSGPVPAVTPPPRVVAPVPVPGATLPGVSTGRVTNVTRIVADAPRSLASAGSSTLSTTRTVLDDATQAAAGLASALTGPGTARR